MAIDTCCLMIQDCAPTCRYQVEILIYMYQITSYGIKTAWVGFTIIEIKDKVFFSFFFLYIGFEDDIY